ncbi:sensory neuron membrane protein 1-like [Copidosoma floridanum]|uniref:sensory neuron membrane protein 1-like n=1 Tax=Copidosoma floridanum TaxID=29053 RepID=UPI0006C9BDC9|nr:sensory neuron membrane protein 1-like [Copidosoma floridanum]
MSRVVKYGAAGAGLFVFGVMFGWMIFPKILKSQVHKQVNLKEGSQVRPLWSKFPFALEFRVYLFNVTNADDIKNGAKPILHEVGPYYFEKWQEKVDLQDHEEDDTVDFSIKNKWIFRPDMSEGLTGNEELIYPHIFILAMAMGAVREKPAMLPIVNKAINSIFKSPDNVFVKVRAMDVMFDGLPIDCTVQDIAGSAVCAMVKENADELMKDGENKYKFSLFGAKNDTASKKRLRVLRGVKHQMDVGVVVEYNGKKNISTWDDEYCDTFNGTDGTVFHPFFGEKEDIVTFAPDICRSLSFTHERKSSYKGFHTSRYTGFLGDPNTMPWQKCYCPSPDKCLGKGVMDIYKCTGVPLVLSHAHFYRGDESYLTMVDGLNPSKEKHDLFLEFEPFTGTPLLAMSRIQMNIMIHKVEKIKIMKNFPEAMLPLLWIEESVGLPDWLLKQVKSGLRMVAIAGYLKWLMIFGGLIMCGFAVFFYFHGAQKSSNRIQLPKVTSNNSSNSGSVDKKISPLSVRTLHAAQVPAALD